MPRSIQRLEGLFNVPLDYSSLLYIIELGKMGKVTAILTHPLISLCCCLYIVVECAITCLKPCVTCGRKTHEPFKVSNVCD